MSSSIWSESSKPILLSYCHGFGTGIALHCREIQRTTMKKALKIHFLPALNEVCSSIDVFIKLWSEKGMVVSTKMKYLGERKRICWKEEEARVSISSISGAGPNDSRQSQIVWE